MNREIDPIHFDPATDGVKFSLMGDKGLARVIKQQMENRQDVWNAGFWPDEKTEKIARQCAEIFGEALGLPAAFIPKDSIWLLVKYDGESVQFASEVMMEEFGCEVDWRELNNRKLLTFGDMVAIAKNGKGKVDRSPPKKFQQNMSWIGCALGKFLIVGIPLIGVGLIIWCIIRHFMKD